MFGLFKKKTAAATAQPSQEDFLKSIRSNMVDRRDFPRIRYIENPVFAQRFIQCSYNGQALTLTNLSLGGMLVNHSPVAFAPNQAVFKFQMVWPGGPQDVSVEAKLLSGSQGRYHFQFVKKDDRYTYSFPKIMMAGLRGFNTRQYEAQEIPANQNLSELWLSAKGDFLKFSSKDEAATLCYRDKRWRWVDGSKFLCVTKVPGSEEQITQEAPTKEALLEIVQFLANLRAPTKRVNLLIGEISKSLV